MPFPNDFITRSFSQIFLMFLNLYFAFSLCKVGNCLGNALFSRCFSQLFFPIFPTCTQLKNRKNIAKSRCLPCSAMLIIFELFSFQKENGLSYTDWPLIQLACFSCLIWNLCKCLFDLSNLKQTPFHFQKHTQQSTYI